ncbi:hypothetical protein R50073_19190 [Maricurvus nonylphenolicus]|uniref:sulfatase family protein n=1 Tax=Maricurvus nonylphenolicus TaxID=1008307 RepID=UPI0036F3B7B4
MRQLLLAGFLGLFSAAVLANTPRPNIVVIMSDDHAVKAVSAYDDSLMQTPNIDRIANQGMKFNRAYVANAICGPSRATLLTGAHSHKNGFYSNEWSGPFDGHQVTLPKLLKQAGYHTSVIGKWHLYSDPVGFDHWEVIDNMMEQGSYYNPHFRSAEGIEKSTGYVADLITDKSIDWLASVKGSHEPFLLIYNHKSPHRDWLPGPEELATWDENLKVEEPDTLLRDMKGEVSARRSARMDIETYMTDLDVKLSKPMERLTPEQEALWEKAFTAGNKDFEAQELSREDEIRWKYQRYIKTYMGSVKSMDRQIGRLLDYLDEQQLTENTLIIYTSDQGFFLGENGWFDKRWIDDISARVPLLIQWPGKIKPGSESDSLVQNIDFAPTLLNAAGVKSVPSMQGQNMMPLLQGEEWQRDLYYHFYENPGFHGVERHYGIIDKRYKLVHYYRANEWELFDLQADPAEQHNIYGQAAFADIQHDLEQRLIALRKQYQVPETDPEAPWYHSAWVWMMESLIKLM